MLINEHTWQLLRISIVDQDKPRIDQEAHFELRMNGEDVAAEVYERTGSLEYALMQTGEDWSSDPRMTAVYNRSKARVANGGTLLMASGIEQNDEK